jgi:energy-coupling factor transporter ATP-binding protein EcfA2
MEGERPHGEAIPAGGAGKGTPRLRVRSLKIHQFREVRPGTELTFGDGFHLILGKNATGKSTLLEILAAVSKLDFRGPFFAETPFHIEASLEVGEVSVHAEIRRKIEPHQLGAVELPALDDAESIARIEHAEAGFLQWVRVRSADGLRIHASDPRSSPDGGALVPFLGNVNAIAPHLIWILGFGAMVQDEGRAERVHPSVWPIFVRLSEHPGTREVFDEALGALHVMVGDRLHVGRDEHLRSVSPWLPPALAFEASGEPVTLDLSVDPLLKAVVELLGFEGAKAYFGPAASAKAGWQYSSPSFQFFRHGKAVRRHDQLSFGQQRLFSFAWYLACNPDIAVADELVNGLHQEWIDWCVEALGDRQCFLTSQNPLLVDAIPFATESDVRHGIIVCSSSPDATGEGTELSFRNLDDEEGSILGQALQQSRLDVLSDLLRALGLW